MPPPTGAALGAQAHVVGAERSLVRIALLRGSTRVHLAVAAHAPVVELLPVMAGMLEPAGAGGSAPSGAYDTGGAAAVDTVRSPPACVVVTAAGHRLDPELGLAAQGVRDGALLVLAGPEDPLSTAAAEVGADAVDAVDDVAAAVAAVVEGRRAAPADPARRAAAAGLLVAVSPLVLLLAPGQGHTGAFALAATAALLGLVSVLAATAPAPALAAAVGACAWAAVAGADLAVDLLPGSGGGADVSAPTGAGLALPFAVGASAGAVVGAVGLALLRARRPSVLPPVVVGVVVAACSLGAHLLGADPLPLLLTAAGGATLALPGLPRLVLTAGGLESRPGVPRTASGDALTAVDRAEEVLVAGAATLALLLVVLAPLAVASGASATVLVLLAAVSLLAGAGRHRSRLVSGAWQAAGALVATVVAAAVVVLQPTWRPGVAVVLMAGGVLLAASAATGDHPGRRARAERGRDRLERVVLVAVVPVTGWATGLVEAVAASVLAVLGVR